MSQASPAIRFFNTMGRELQTFEPLVPGKVSIYTCGPTVYNIAHIGNLRTFVFEDFLRRSLRFLGLEVKQVMNLTDVDDKTIRSAVAAGVSLRDFTDQYVEAFFIDLDRLHVERAEHYPRATDHVAEMITLIETLLERDFAYRSEEGSIFFRITADADYGRLSGIDLDHVRQGERVASDEYDKEDLRDFVLWKAAKEGEPSWDSPWGQGRPGWHLECSAMSMKYLGETFDIHCGGVDNIFPHHENEIAQSESATDSPFARTWLHAEHLIVENQKMSKSLGNQFTLDDLVERGADLRAVRTLFVSTHYRQKLNFTFDSLGAVGKSLRRIDELWFRLEHTDEADEERSQVTELVEALQRDFSAALAQDLNASEAWAAVFQFIREVNKLIEQEALGVGDRDRIAAAIRRVDQVLGVLDPAAWATEDESAQEGLSDAEIDEMLAARQAARQRRDFAEADRLRDELQAAGVVIEDTPSGPRWRRA